MSDSDNGSDRITQAKRVLSIYKIGELRGMISGSSLTKEFISYSDKTLGEAAAVIAQAILDHEHKNDGEELSGGE